MITMSESASASPFEEEEETYLDSSIDINAEGSSIAAETGGGEANAPKEDVPIALLAVIIVMLVLFSAFFTFLVYKEEKAKKAVHDSPLDTDRPRDRTVKQRKKPAARRPKTATTKPKTRPRA
jgi:hypothetical protein